MWPNCREIFQSLLPAKSKICKKNRYERAMAHARDSLTQEVRINNIVRMMRYFNQAIAEIIPEQRRLQILEYSRFIKIDIEDL